MLARCIISLMMMIAIYLLLRWKNVWRGLTSLIWPRRATIFKSYWIVKNPLMLAHLLLLACCHWGHLWTGSSWLYLPAWFVVSILRSQLNSFSFIVMVVEECLTGDEGIIQAMEPFIVHAYSKRIHLRLHHCKRLSLSILNGMGSTVLFLGFL